jgi:transcriptional regulator with XRE-family HTH domain
MPTTVALRNRRTAKRKVLSAMLPGRVQLSEWLIAHETSGAAFCGRIGVGQPSLSRILLGDRKPSLRTALAIKDVTGIPPEAWRVHDVPPPRPPRFRRNGSGR